MDNNGVQTFVAMTSQQVSETKDELTAEDKSGKETTYQLTLKNQKAAKATSVNFAVWSERNDQDDLVWYEGKKRLQIHGVQRLRSRIIKQPENIWFMYMEL